MNFLVRTENKKSVGALENSYREVLIKQRENVMKKRFDMWEKNSWILH